MFKSIEYKLVIYLLLLVLSLVAATAFIIRGEILGGILCAFVAIFSLTQLFRNYKKFNKNILFLFNALENGDYSFHFSTTRLSMRERELNGMLNRIKDILAQARREIIENESFLSVIVESVSTGIIITDTGGFVRNVNLSALEQLGLESLSHLNQLRMIDSSFPHLFSELKPGENPPVRITSEREEKQVSLRMTEILVSGEPLRIITLTNIGNELEAKEMESWIRLIRVMTHEIMNSVAPIASLSESLLLSFRRDASGEANEMLISKTTDALETIYSTTRGLLSFVESYRRFTRIPQPQLKCLAIKPLLENILNLEESELRERDIRVEILMDNNCQEIFADERQLSQILINLVKNSAESFDADNITPPSGKRIEIRLITTQKHTIIEVRDNGSPVPPDVVPHIFVPFFTTKESGSGIGLSLSRYIMRLHGGNLKYHADDEWTVFSMIFPLNVKPSSTGVK